MDLAPYEELMNTCRKAMHGDEEALQDLHMDDIRASVPKTLHLDKATLQREFTATETMAVATRKCGVDVLESQCVKTMGYILAITQAKMFTLESQTDPSDVAEIMLALLDEEKSRIVLQPITKGDGCSGDSAED